MLSAALPPHLMKVRARGQRRASLAVVTNRAVSVDLAGAGAAGAMPPRRRSSSEPKRASWQLSTLRWPHEAIRPTSPPPRLPPAVPSSPAPGKSAHKRNQQHMQQQMQQQQIMQQQQQQIQEQMQQNQHLQHQHNSSAAALSFADALHVVDGIDAELSEFYAAHDMRIAKPGFRNDDSFIFFDDAIQCASTDRLVDLVGSSQLDAALADILVFSHPLFIDSDDLLARLVAKFWLPAAQHSVDKFNERRGMSRADVRRHSQLSVVRFLCTWLASWLGDFATPDLPVAMRLDAFVERLRAPDADAGRDTAERLAWADALAMHLVHFRELEARRNRAPLYQQAPRAESRFSALLSIPPTTLAHQWALVNSAVLSQMDLHELCRGRWTTAGAAPSIDRLSTWLDQRSFWIASEIVSEGNQSKRLDTLVYFLSVAEVSVELNDFMALRAIYLALQLNEVARLKHMWSELPDELAIVWRTVSALMDYDRNSQVYRLILHERQPPFLPCPTVFLKDLLKHHEQGPEPAAPHLLSVVRLRRWTADVARLRAAQVTPYSFECDVDVVDWLLHRSHVMSRAELRAVGLRCESSAEAPTLVSSSRGNDMLRRSSQRKAQSPPVVAPAPVSHPGAPMMRMPSTGSLPRTVEAASTSSTQLRHSSDAGATARRASDSTGALPDAVVVAAPAVPAKCERCGKRPPERRVELNVKICVCAKCFAALRKVTGPSLYGEVLPVAAAPEKPRSGLLSSLRRRASKSATSTNVDDELPSQHSDSEDESQSSSSSMASSSSGSSAPSRLVVPKSRRQQVRDAFASKVQAFSQLAATDIDK